MLEEFLFAGFGGQGVMFAGQLLSYAAMDAGMEVTWIPSYGPEMRGGTAHCSVVISDRPIGSPLVRFPKVAVIFNEPSFDKYESLVDRGGLLIVNSSIIQRTSQRSDLTQVLVPASQLAGTLGNMRVTNMILLGAALAARPVLPLDVLRRSLEKRLPERHRNLLALNLQALEQGAECAADIRLT